MPRSRCGRRSAACGRSNRWCWRGRGPSPRGAPRPWLLKPPSRRPRRRIGLLARSILAARWSSATARRCAGSSMTIKGGRSTPRLADGGSPHRGPGVAPTEPGREKRGFAEEQLGRLAGCIRSGLDEVKEQQEVIREYVAVIAEVAATLEPGTEDITERQEQFEALS